MRPLLALALTLALLGTTTAVAHAQDEMSFDAAEVPDIYRDAPPAESVASPNIGNDEDALHAIYGDDPLFNTKLDIERHLGIYLIAYPQRDESERVDVNRKGIEASIWVSIGAREENELACKMVRWVIFGRTRWARGARGVFSEFADLDSLAIRFINVRQRDGKRGRVKKEVNELMEGRLTRKDFDKLDLEAVQDMLAREECIDAARKVLSAYSFNQRYYDKFKDSQ